MKTFNQYIIEKLRINKDIEFEADVLDKYSTPDKCLFISKITTSKGAVFSVIDAIKIRSKIDDKKIMYEYLTDCFKKKESLDILYIDVKDNDKYIVDRSRIDKMLSVIIPANEGKKIIDDLLKENSYSIEIREYTEPGFDTSVTAGPNRYMPITLVERKDDFVITDKRKIITKESLENIRKILSNE